MEINAQASCTDLSNTGALSDMIGSIPGVPLTAKWIDDPDYTFHWARTALLEKKLGEPIVFVPEHWIYYIQGVLKYGGRRYMQFAYASTSDHYGAIIKFWLHERHIIMVIMWVTNGHLDSSGDDAIFHWGLARVDFTPEQSEKLGIRYKNVVVKTVF